MLHPDVSGHIGIHNDRDVNNAGRDFFENFEPFPAQAALELSKAGDVYTRPRIAWNKPRGNWIRDLHEDDGYGGRLSSQSSYDGFSIGPDGDRSQVGELSGEGAHAVGVAARPAVIDVEISALTPTQSLQPLPKRLDAALSFRVVGDAHQHADPPHPLALLPPRRERPSSRRAAEQRDELAAFQLIELHSVPCQPERRLPNFSVRG